MQVHYRSSIQCAWRRARPSASVWQRMALAVLLCFPAAVEGQSIYYGFTLLDPAEQRVVENAYIVVDGTQIVAVGSGTPPHGEAFERIDMAGRYALPGFIDAHAHIATGMRTIDMSSGSPILREETSEELTRFQALVALSSGVTTIRNPAGVPEAGVRYRDNVRSGRWLGPEILQAGSLFGGRPLEWALHPTNAEEWREAIDREVDFDFEFVKLYTGLSEVELELGIMAAHARGLPAIAHLDRVSWTRAAELGIDALTHSLPTSEDLLVEPARSAYIATRETPSAKFMYQWWEWVDLDSEPVQEMIQELADKQIEVDLTLIVNELIYWFNEIDSLPYMPVDEWMHPDHRATWRDQIGGSLYDWTAEDFTRARSVMPKVLEFARRLHQAGIPLLIGTDGTGGGPLLARELELHVKAGIPVWDVLALVTTKSAERLGLGDRTGALRANFDADIVFLEANPLDDITYTRRVDTVVLKGRAYQADELMEQMRRIAE